MVKKITLVCGIALALSVLAAVMVVSPALAYSPVDGNLTGAVVTQNFLCGVFVPTGGFAVTTDSIDVENPAGEETVVCHFDVVNPTGEAAVESHGLCSGSYGFTTSDLVVESVSGQLTLTCHFPTRP